MALRQVHLGGELGEQFGPLHKLDVATVGEAVQAMEANYPGFFQALRRVDASRGAFKVTIANRTITEDELTLVAEGDILIEPTYEGASAKVRMVIGAALIAVAAFYTGGLSAAFTTTGWATVSTIGASLIIGGVIEMLTPVPTMGAGNSAESLESYGIGGGQAPAQGEVLGVVYGRLRVSPQLISIGIEAK